MVFQRKGAGVSNRTC